MPLPSQIPSPNPVHLAPLYHSSKHVGLVELDDFLPVLAAARSTMGGFASTWRGRDLVFTSCFPFPLTPPFSCFAGDNFKLDLVVVEHVVVEHLR